MQCSYKLVTISWKDGLPRSFRAALGGFLVGCVELGITGNEKNWKWVVFQNGWAVNVSISNSPIEESGKNRDICRRWCRNQKHGSRTDGKVIVLLNRRQISSLIAWNNVRWELKIHVSYSSCSQRQLVTAILKKVHEPIKYFSWRDVLFTLLSTQFSGLVLSFIDYRAKSVTFNSCCTYVVVYFAVISLRTWSIYDQKRMVTKKDEKYLHFNSESDYVAGQSIQNCQPIYYPL